jgi:hypothetical protein
MFAKKVGISRVDNVPDSGNLQKKSFDESMVELDFDSWWYWYLEPNEGFGDMFLGRQIG